MRPRVRVPDSGAGVRTGERRGRLFAVNADAILSPGREWSIRVNLPGSAFALEPYSEPELATPGFSNCLTSKK